jgi:hypothetical protein
MTEKFLETTDRYGEQLDRLKENIAHEAVGCAADTADYDDCVDCVEGAGSAEEARDRINEKHAVIAGGGIAAGAATGCAVGFIGGSIGGPLAGATCAAGALIGALVGLAMAVDEYLDAKNEIDDMEEETFSPCREKRYKYS